MATIRALIDSFNEVSYTGATQRISSAFLSGKVSQSFNANLDCTITDCVLYLDKVLLPTGSATVKIYAHTGTYGASSLPTGAALATSDNFDVSTFASSPALALATFTFSGVNKIALTKDTKYVLQLEYTGGDASNYVEVGFISYDSDIVYPVEHPGNGGAAGTVAEGYLDAIFYVYGDITVSTNTNSKSFYAKQGFS